MIQHFREAKKRNPSFSESSLFLNLVQWEFIANQKKRLSSNSLQRIKYTTLYTGIPEQYRGLIWTKILDIDTARSKNPNNFYSKLCQIPNEDASRDIKKDVDRTMNELGLWDEDLFCGNNKLYNVLIAYANYDNEVGYVQGMNYITALLIFYIKDEEQVFWCLYQIMVTHDWR